MKVHEGGPPTLNLSREGREEGGDKAAMLDTQSHTELLDTYCCTAVRMVRDKVAGLPFGVPVRLSAVTLVHEEDTRYTAVRVLGGVLRAVVRGEPSVHIWEAVVRELCVRQTPALVPLWEPVVDVAAMDAPTQWIPLAIDVAVARHAIVVKLPLDAKRRVRVDAQGDVTWSIPTRRSATVAVARKRDLATAVAIAMRDTATPGTLRSKLANLSHLYFKHAPCIFPFDDEVLAARVFMAWVDVDITPDDLGSGPHVRATDNALFVDMYTAPWQHARLGLRGERAHTRVTRQPWQHTHPHPRQKG
jgi:hypothetical protein